MSDWDTLNFPPLAPTQAFFTTGSVAGSDSPPAGVNQVGGCGKRVRPSTTSWQPSWEALVAL